MFNFWGYVILCSTYGTPDLAIDVPFLAVYEPRLHILQLHGALSFPFSNEINLNPDPSTTLAFMSFSFICFFIVLVYDAEMYGILKM